MKGKMNKMKKLGIVFILLIIAICFTGCKNKNTSKVGSFYNLQEAFDKGLLSHDDLQAIADFNTTTNSGCTGSYPETLDKRIEEKKLSDYKNIHDIDPDREGAIRYFGTYNGCVVMMIDYLGGFLACLTGETVDGVHFSYGSSQKITVWKE